MTQAHVATTFFAMKRPPAPRARAVKSGTTPPPSRSRGGRATRAAVATRFRGGTAGGGGPALHPADRDAQFADQPGVGAAPMRLAGGGIAGVALRQPRVGGRTQRCHIDRRRGRRPCRRDRRTAPPQPVRRLPRHPRRRRRGGDRPAGRQRGEKSRLAVGSPAVMAGAEGRRVHLRRITYTALNVKTTGSNPTNSIPVPGGSGLQCPDQAASAVRRRSAAPVSAKPASSIPHAAGSGTAAP